MDGAVLLSPWTEPFSCHPVILNGAAGGVKDLEHHPGSLPRTGMRTTNIPILYLTVNQSVTELSCSRSLLF